MQLHRVTIMVWPRLDPHESEGVHSWAAAPGKREGKKVRVSV